ncbi:MAG TPA: trypsin-like peptidase domain-containing protein [Phycisphaerae bacterium]|nr:trypsin-like peptidase domain-containing protein [Phycisphaerae bacterium]
MRPVLCFVPGQFVTALLAVATNSGPALAADAVSRSLRRTPVVIVVENARDSVVNIAATQVMEIKSGLGWVPDLFDPPFSDRQPRRYERTSLGSGFILHPDGYVVTNAHVAARAARLKITFADGSEHEADPVAFDDSHDLAVLKIKEKGTFPAIRLGRSDDILIGETVVTIGNPLGYQHTVTTGIVSAVDRKITFNDGNTYQGLIQTDTGINPGNSGGPLLNILGELIGITTAIRGDAQNIGFAIPVDTLRKSLPAMLSTEHRQRLRIGLRLTWHGMVQVVEATGPAAAAGVEPGDELVSINSHPIAHDFDFYIHLLQADPKKRLTLGLKRGGKSITAAITPEAIPVPDGAVLLRQKFGLVVRLLTPEQIRKLDIDGRLLITQVERGSPAERAGFVPGLIIFQIGKFFPGNLEEVGVILEHVGRGEKMTFKVYEVQQMFIRVLAGSLTAR